LKNYKTEMGRAVKSSGPEIGLVIHAWVVFNVREAPPSNSSGKLTFLLMALSQSHAGTSAVLVDEFDAGELKCMLDHLKCRPPRIVAPGLELADRYYPYSRLLGQISLPPIK
jgi:hypothetical protein